MKASDLERWRGWPRGELGRLWFLALTVLAVMAWLNPDRFLAARNLSSMAFQFPELGLLALAVALPMITGGIDLSIVSLANLSGILAALVLTLPGAETPAAMTLRIGLALGVGLLTGAAGGALNGLLIGRMGLTPILATLGTMQFLMGVSFVITRGPAVAGYPEPFLWLGNGTLAHLPVPLVLIGAVALATAVWLGRTRFGLQLYLYGSNPTAARYAGFKLRSLLLRAYVGSGVLSAIAGLLMISRTNAAKADYGTSYLLQAILVAILGGVHPNGGRGTVAGVLLAVLSLQFLASGFSLLRLSQFTQEFAWGALLLAVMLLQTRSGGIGWFQPRDAATHRL